MRPDERELTATRLRQIASEVGMELSAERPDPRQTRTQRDYARFGDMLPRFLVGDAIPLFAAVGANAVRVIALVRD